MKCFNCGSLESKVIDSRFNEKNNSIKRRRECLTCGSRFSTYEIMEEEPIFVIKKNNSVEEFNLEKLKLGITKACQKRQVTKEQIDNIALIVKNKAYNIRNRKIKSNKIGEIVLEELKKIDEICYFRFLCVFKNFDNLENMLLNLNIK